MSYFDEASLVFIPSGYKTSKAYSIKPTDGTGDLTFTRSNDTATRVAPNGLIEKVRTNLVLQSVWPSIGTGVAPTSWVVGTGPATSFSAGPLAGQLLCNTSASRGFITQSVSLTAGEYALSVFVDSVTTTNAVADLVLIFGSTNRKYYEDGVEVNLNTNVVAGKRYAMVGTVTTGSFSMRIGSGVNANATANYVISRPQLEASDFGATPYIPTTTAAVSVGPVANVPRLDYTGGGCPKLLLEPQRVNVTLQSETITAATGTTVTLNTTTAPTGLNTADKLVEDTSTGLHFTSFGGVLGGTTDSSVYCVSIFAKAAGRTRLVMFDNGQVASGATNFDLSNGTTTSGTGRIENYGNGWYRCTIFPAKSTSTIANVQIRMIDAGTNTSYTGNGTSGLFLWGKQIEPSATYQTTYIPTLGAAVTRGADACSKQNIAGTLPTAYPFTLYAEGFLRENNDMLLSINDIAASDVYYQIGATASGFIASARNTAGSSASTSSGRSVGTHKVAAVFTSSEIRLFANGALIATAANAQTFNTNANDVLLGQLRVASDFGLRSSVNQALVFKSALTDSEVIELTTL